MSEQTKKITKQIANELQVHINQVAQAVALLHQGDTVPFIARYRKEKTQGLDDIQLRFIDTRLQLLTALELRKQAIILALESQGALTDSLRTQIEQCDNKARLEDIYQPFKSKRKTKAMLAIELGLKPLAEQLWRGKEPTKAHLTAYIKGEFDSEALVSEGAEAIILEQHSQNLTLIDYLQQRLLNQTYLCSQVQKGKEDEGEKFKDYFEYKELIKRVPSHRLLAARRGKAQGILQLQLDPFVDLNRAEKQQAILTLFCRFFKLSATSLTVWQVDLLQHLWTKKLKTKLENSWLNDYTTQAEKEAINVFANNLNSLLLSAPAGNRVTIGLDPGLRTGVKVAVVDETGKVVATDTIYPTPPHNRIEQAGQSLLKLIQKYHVQLIAIGNGTGSKETDLFVADLLKENFNTASNIQKVMVSEAGASVYSASALASEELPELNVSLRGAVSIARRLQDPLAELIKIDPKSIGVGQYQHDVDQAELAQSLQSVVEDAVNKVGVDLNQASPALLSYISGLNETIARIL